LLLWLGVILAALAIVAAIAYATLAARPTPAVAARPNLASSAAARQILANLVDLEERFEGGGIEETAYEQERNAAYEELRALTKD
jgi:hypothetical protein